MIYYYNQIIPHLHFLLLLMKLDPELDKLRNKELSFWCAYTNWSLKVAWEYTRYTDWLHPWDKEDKVIIWHPLTWWRICHLLWAWINLNTKNIQSLISTRWSMVAIFDYNSDLYDQNELQRMQSPYRPELKELLIKFSDTFT